MTWSIGANVPYAPLDSLSQEGFRFRNDDGSEIAATWKRDQDSNISLSSEGKARLRVLVDSSGDVGSTQFKLQYKKASDPTWKDMT